MRRRVVPLVVLILASSCNTYLIPVESFRQQLATVTDTTLRDVTVRGPLGETTTYQTYPIVWIECVDKKGKLVQLRNSLSIEIRFTDTTNKKTHFYFDRLRVTDSTVTGATSRILAPLRKTISLKAVTKIEVQDGKKRYRYVD